MSFCSVSRCAWTATGRSRSSRDAPNTPDGRRLWRVRSVGRVAVALVLALGAVSCEMEDRATPRDEAATAEPRTASDARRFVAAVWDTVFIIGGAIQDSVVFLPRTLTAGAGRLYVYDYGDTRLKAFDDSGDLIWTFGKPGAGPREFGNVFDIELDSRGAIWAIDAGNGRIAVVDPDGTPNDIIPYASRMVRDVLPTRDGVLVTPMSPAKVLWLALDSAGSVTHEQPLPEIADLTRTHFMARGTFAALGPGQRTWSAVFPFGNLLLVHDGRRLRCAGRLVEGEPFPDRWETGSRPPVWAAGVALGDSSVFVLARGQTDAALRMVDVYSSRNCGYSRTLRLPVRATAIASDDGTFFVAYEDPAPAILALRPE